MLSKSLPISSLVALLSLAGFSPLISFWFVRVFFGLLIFFSYFVFKRTSAPAELLMPVFVLLLSLLLLFLGGL